MKRYIIAIVLVLGLFTTSTCIADNAQSLPIKVTIKAYPHVVLPFEPVLVEVMATNVSASPCDFESSEAPLCAFVRRPGDKYPFGVGYFGGGGSVGYFTQKTIRPGESIKYFTWVSVGSKLTPLLAKPGRYFLTGCFQATEPWNRITSAELPVVVTRPKGIDAFAFHYLEHRPLYRNFPLNDVARADETDQSGADSIAANQKFVSLFPNSKYADWVRKTIFLLSLTDKVNEVSNATAVAGNMPRLPAAMVWVGSGQFAKWHRDGKAQLCFDAAASESHDPILSDYIQYVAERAW